MDGKLAPGGTEPTRGDSLSRRAFIKIAGGAAAGGLALPLLLEACGGAATSAPGSSGGAPASTAGSGGSVSVAANAPKTANSVFPTYIPTKGGPKPDIPSTGPEYEDGFDAYPANPTKSWTGDPPGAGSNITIMSIALFPPPTPFDQNPAWKAVNKALNANVQYQVVTAADYGLKLATTMAGTDIPDAMFLYSPPGSSSAMAAAPGTPQFLQSKAADLTPYLSGDAAKDYPFLAAIPTPAWKNAGAAYQGKLYLIPIHRYLPGFMWLKNAQVYDKEIGQDYVPKDATDFKKILQQLTKPGTFYGMGAGLGNIGGNLWMSEFAKLFGAPNGWAADANGKLTRMWEAPAYKEAVSYVKDLWTSGVFHPNSATYASGVVARGAFAGGNWALWMDPINGWQDAWRQAMSHTPPFDVHIIPPFSARPDIKPQHNVTGGHLWGTAIKNGPPERIKEMLRVMNYLAAPFGSQEDELLTYGLKDTDYTLDPKGNPVLTKAGNGDANYVPWKYTVQHPFVYSLPDIPNWAKIGTDAEHAVMPFAVSDPTFGYSSATAFSKGKTVDQAMTDGINDILFGRRQFSEYDQLVKDWQANGGDTMRKEFMDSIASSK